MPKPVLLSAIQPTNRLTLGNYLGAIRQWVQMQAEYDCLFFAVDLHAITTKQDPKLLRENTYLALATYLAAGIDPDQATLFVQSHVPEHAELAWVLSCFGYMGELSRMTQYKDKSAKQGANIPVGLFTYPLLMAADILLYRTEFVPVGADQKQHVELTRDIAERMNNAYPGSSDADRLFIVPKPTIPPVAARVMSLSDPSKKMSKSDPDAGAAVFLLETNDQIVKKIKRAVTDSGSEITYDDSKPGVKNLLEIQAAVTGKDPRTLALDYVGKQYGHLKVETAEAVVAVLGPLRERTQALLQDRTALDGILAKGAAHARARAKTQLARVYERVGFLGRH